MHERMEESVYLTDREFIVLAACAGLTEADALFRKPVSTDMTEQEVRYICHDLLRRKALEPGKGPVEPYLTMMKTIEAAPQVILVTLRDPARTLCYYLGRSVVRTEISPLEENSIRIRLLSGEDFPKDFLSLEAFPRTECGALEPDEAGKERIRKLLNRPPFFKEQFLEEKELPENVMMNAELFHSGKRKVIRRILMLEDSGRDYTAVFHDGGFGSFLYTGEEFTKLLRQIQGESEQP